MKKLFVIWLGMFILFNGLCYGKEPVKTPAKTGKITAKNEKLFAKVDKDGIIFYTGGTMYTLQSEGISSSGNMLYFAAKDFTDNKDLITKKITKIECRVDTPERKVYKTTIQLGDNSIEPGYRLEVFSEIKKGYPFLALYSKFFYLGKDVHKCGINWGLSSPYNSDPYKYYTMPQDGKFLTYPLKDKDGKSKIGYAKWLYLHNGKGSGIGLICPAMIGKGADFIFINSVPPEKELSETESSDVFMVYLPIEKNFKILDKLYDEVMKMQWTFD
ncbi:MAG: hypothetical protein NTY10_01610 [Candidatus Omnitrophica bacterium]|nr:hypothetical protein [Candidatus Omnitrophota bacterium]